MVHHRAQHGKPAWKAQGTPPESTVWLPSCCCFAENTEPTNIFRSHTFALSNYNSWMHNAHPCTNCGTVALPKKCSSGVLEYVYLQHLEQHSLYEHKYKCWRQPYEPNRTLWMDNGQRATRWHWRPCKREQASFRSPSALTFHWTIWTYGIRGIISNLSNHCCASPRSRFSILPGALQVCLRWGFNNCFTTARPWTSGSS